MVFSLGLGGRDKPTVDGNDAATSNMLNPLIGMQPNYLHEIVPHYKLGVIAGAFFANTEAINNVNIGYSTFVDLSLLGKGYYRFPKVPIELYGTMFVGASLFVPNSDLSLNVGGGVNFGFAVGFQYIIAEHVGIGLEPIAFTLHWYSAETSDANSVRCTTCSHSTR